MYHIHYLLLPLFSRMHLLASGSDASSNPNQVTLNPGINASKFHSANPAFPFLLPGNNVAVEPVSKSMFNRVCFRFIYAITVNVTKVDDPSFFYKLFNRQCAVGDKNKCGEWSDNLLQAIRKKMGAVKLLGKDGHIGRSKKKTADEALEARLPPTLTGITSYANWCNKLHKDLAVLPLDSEKEVPVVKEAKVNTTKALTLKIGDGVRVNSTDTPKAQVTQVVQKTEQKTQVTKAAQKSVQSAPAKDKNDEVGKVPEPIEAKTQENEGCYCFHRGSKKICHCDQVKHSSEADAFKSVGSKLKGAGIAEQMSKAASNERGLDDAEKMMHTARVAAERHAHGKA